MPLELPSGTTLRGSVHNTKYVMKQLLQPLYDIDVGESSIAVENVLNCFLIRCVSLRN